jgi:methylase of polypeptide subunit release factors
MALRFKSLLVVIGLVTAQLSAAIEKTDKICAAEELLAQNYQLSERYSFEFRDRQYIGFPNVYSPVIFGGANKQSNLPVKSGDHFLELGCGTGIFSVMAALQGAERVVALDINPDAVANTNENARLHRVDDRVSAFESDMFTAVAGQRFDLIFFNIPFCHRNCAATDMTLLARSLYDPEHELLHRFLRDGAEHLKEGGRLMLGYSTTHGDIAQMHQWATQYGWEVTQLYKQGDETVDFFTVELYELRRK